MTRTTLRPGRLTAVALVLLVAGILCYGIAQPAARPLGLLRDFNAFYCAGRALDRHADPYRSEPLGNCERAPKPAPLLTGERGLVMPAPLPPYALLPFVALGRLPYPVAAFVWSCCIVLSVGVAVVALRRATGVPYVPLVAAFALGDGYASLCLGQIAPIAVAAIAVAARLLGRRRDEAAAFALTFAMIEPHVGLPACLAAFVYRRQTRAIFLGAALLAACLSVAVAGVPACLEYVRAVLPAHVLSEVVNEKQFSLTYALHRLGASEELAARAGEWWYLAMLAAGVSVGRAVAKRTGDNAAVVVIPPALTLIGGPFVHISQIFAALPAAFVLYRHAGGKTRPALGIAIALLAIPWIQFSNSGSVFLALAPLATGILVATLVDGRPAPVAGAVLATLLFLEQLTFAATTGRPDTTRELLAQYDPRALAETTWAVYVRTVGTINGRALNLAKLPTLLGLVTLAYFAVATALGRITSQRSTAVRAQSWERSSEPVANRI